MAHYNPVTTFFPQKPISSPLHDYSLFPSITSTLLCNTRPLTLSRQTQEINASGKFYGAAQVALHDISRDLSTALLQEQQAQLPAVL